MTFKDVRNLLLIGPNDGFIDNDEFVFLYDLYASRNPDFPHDPYAPFDLEELDQRIQMVRDAFPYFPSLIAFRFKNCKARSLELRGASRHYGLPSKENTWIYLLSKERENNSSTKTEDLYLVV